MNLLKRLILFNLMWNKNTKKKIGEKLKKIRIK